MVSQNVNSVTLSVLKESGEPNSWERLFIIILFEIYKY